ncbi:Na+/H+ antiporter NhaC [Brevibacterium sp. CFH 10365]|uniref:Na+/H+ antiporter NhaC n=1 Tax=Brevibacterium sp. CFH 10365 TaxID=2585207 RepID=UPI001266147A|nr:Na+/H+ antiporter NhaC [Brevibacterium sp. CFH 10365]
MVTETQSRLPGLTYSLVAFATIVLIIAGGMLIFDASLQLMLLLAMIVAFLFAMRLGSSYAEVEGYAYGMIKSALQPVMIILAVGALIGTWILSGTVSAMIYAGLQIVTPSLFLPSAVIMCAIVSLATGTSWGTIGTAGIALVAIGEVLGISTGMTVGAIVSGAFFGDKMSPLSDSTNLAPAVCGAKLIPHIKHMVWTTVPALILTLGIFTVLGFTQHGEGGDTAVIESTSAALSAMFNIGFMSIVPAIVVIAMLLMKMPALLSIVTGALVGGAVAVLNEEHSVAEALSAMYNGNTFSSDNEFINELLNRGGVVSMYEIAALMLFALGLGGVLQGAGVMESLLQPVSRIIKTERGVIVTTMAVSYITNMIGATMSFAAVMTGTMMRKKYQEFRIKPENLSRVIEDCGTLGAPIIPWNTSAVFIAGALGVSPLVYIPFAFLSIITPIISLIYGLTGFTITKYDGDETPPVAAEIPPGAERPSETL